MSNFKEGLRDVQDRLAGLVENAGQLSNQNLADQLRAASGKLSQAAEHPDVDNVGRDHERSPAVDPLNSGGNMQFAAGDPGAKLQAEETDRRAAFDAAAIPAPFPGTTPAADVRHPGEPQFDALAVGAEAANPHDVDLNEDGTLKRAPGVLGTSDNRDK